VDWTILFGSLTLVWRWQPFATPDETGNYGCAGCLLFLASIGAWLAYFAGLESGFGQTLGKMVTDVRVVRLDGTRVDFIDCVKRHLLDAVEFQLFGLPAALIAKYTPTHQRLGDLVAGTRVVRNPEVFASAG